MNDLKPKPCACAGRCCPSIPISEDEAEQLLSAVTGPREKWFRIKNGQLRTQLQIIHEDSVELRCCAFLDPSSKLCIAYAKRPAICREYDCGSRR